MAGVLGEEAGEGEKCAASRLGAKVKRRRHRTEGSCLVLDMGRLWLYGARGPVLTDLAMSSPDKLAQSTTHS